MTNYDVLLNAIRALDDKVDGLFTLLDVQRTKLDRIEKKAGNIMALVQIEQSDLDDLDVKLDDVAKALGDKIQALVDAGTLPAADMSALQADVDALRALAAPTPVEPE